MATQDITDETVDTTTDEEELETPNGEDENSNDEVEDTDSEDTEDSDDEEDSEDSDEEETDEEDEKFEKRFTQFKGESYKEYTPQLEKAYGEALAEMTRTKQKAKESIAQMDTIRQAIATDPDFAEKLDALLDGKTNTVTVDPAILKARQDLEDGMTKDYNDFVESHPELESDPTISEAVNEVLEEYGAMSKKTGKVMSMKDALNRAWSYLGYNATDTKENIIAKAKESASKSKTGNKAKKVSSSKKGGYTDEQIRMAKKWNVEL